VSTPNTPKDKSSYERPTNVVIYKLKNINIGVLGVLGVHKLRGVQLYACTPKMAVHT